MVKEALPSLSWTTIVRLHANSVRIEYLMSWRDMYGS